MAIMPHVAFIPLVGFRIRKRELVGTRVSPAR
jgi:hypothetical protein